MISASSVVNNGVAVRVMCAMDLNLYACIQYLLSMFHFDLVQITLWPLYMTVAGLLICPPLARESARNPSSSLESISAAMVTVLAMVLLLLLGSTLTSPPMDTGTTLDLLSLQ